MNKTLIICTTLITNTTLDTNKKSNKEDIEGDEIPLNYLILNLSHMKPFLKQYFPSTKCLGH